MLLALLASLLTLPDPAGDALGDGGYRLPTRPAISADMLDLRSFSAQERGGGMQFTVTFGQMGNPWNAPGGFSAGVTDIFVKGALGGQQVLADTGLRARGQGGWQYHLRLSASGSTLVQVDTQGQQTALPVPAVQVQGTSLVVNAAVPPGRYGYWVTSSVYTPLSPSGLLRPGAAPGATALQAGRADAPTPVDVLAAPGDTQAFTNGTLAPMGQTRNWVSLTLLGLGAAGLLLTTGATMTVWRRYRA